MSTIELPAGAWECVNCWGFNRATATRCDNCGVDRAIPIPSKGCDEEGELHDEIIKELDGRGYPYFHSRMDRPHTDRLGTPDFIIAASQGRTFYVEAKTRTGKLTTGQSAIRAALEKHGHRYYVVRSIEEFREVIK